MDEQNKDVDNNGGYFFEPNFWENVATHKEIPEKNVKTKSYDEGLGKPFWADLISEDW